MKLFLKQNLPYLLFMLLMAAFLMGLYWLDGYRNERVMIYGFGLAMFFVTLFMLFTYFSQQHLYHSLEKKKNSPVQYEDLKKDGSKLSNEIGQLLEQQYLVYYRELKQLRNTRDEHTRFINQWIHQMKTPLAVMELMVQDQRLDGESLLEECDRLKEGVNLALSMARLEDFQKDFIVEKIDLKAAAVKAVGEYKRSFIRNHVYPKIDIPDELLAETDEKWLSFMLGQLISNAIKYSSGNGETILLKSVTEGKQIGIQIIDKGIGIPKSDLPRVFQPFFTGENGRKHHEATGMGLYLVSEVCCELGHHITVTSTEGEGSIFTLLF